MHEPYTQQMRKTLGWAVSILLVGGLLGYFVTALTGPTMEQMGWSRGESAEASRYMTAMLENEPETLMALTPRADVVSRALQFKMSEENQGQWRPISLTYLGGKTAQGMSVHVYAIELRSASGREQFIPLALTIANGKVIRRA
jgi:hypothetical protein